MTETCIREEAFRVKTEKFCESDEVFIGKSAIENCEEISLIVLDF